jgi:hypothetical protein
MEQHEDITQELNGEGVIMIDGREIGEVYYSLTIVPEPGPLIAEGSISGPEPLLSQVKEAEAPKLALDDGYVVTLKCKGGSNGVRWVNALPA